MVNVSSLYNSIVSTIFQPRLLTLCNSLQSTRLVQADIYKYRESVPLANRNGVLMTKDIKTKGVNTAVACRAQISVGTKLCQTLIGALHQNAVPVL